MKDSLLTVAELSLRLNVHPKTVYRWVKNVQIAHIKKRGLGLRFKSSDIEEWIESGRVPAFPLPEKRAKLEISLPVHDRMALKGDSAVAEKRQRWNYGDYGVFIRKTKRGREVWYGWHYKRVSGKRKRIREAIPGATSREEAVYVVRERAVRAFRDEHHIESQRRDITFEAFAERFYEEHMTMLRKNFRSDKYRLDAAAAYFGDIELRKITPSMVVKFRDTRLKSGNTKSTANRYMALLKKMFNVAISEGYLESNPLAGVKFFSEVDTVRDRVLSPEEELRLLAQCSKRLKPVVLLALNTGMRQGEILGLDWANVDLTRRQIKVERTKSRKARFIPVNSALLETLEALHKESGGVGPLFPFKSVRTAFEKAAKRAQAPGLTFHDLRRTFGTRLLERGVDIVTIQKLYGHSGVSVSERYLHPQDRASIEAVELLSGKKEISSAVLSRICPTEREEASESFPSHLFSRN